MTAQFGLKVGNEVRGRSAIAASAVPGPGETKPEAEVVMRPPVTLPFRVGHVRWVEEKGAPKMTSEWAYIDD